MQLVRFIDECVKILTPYYPQREAGSIAVRLLQEIGGFSAYAHLVYPDTEIDDRIGIKLQECVRELSTGRPLQYVLGFERFCGYKFKVSEGVLIPRPETEELVGLIMDRYKNYGGRLSILDICTGSGCIAHSLAAGLGEKASVYGCDISQAALDIASGQDISGFSPRFFRCDILDDNAVEVIKAECCISKFDIIVSNPPYVCDSERVMMRSNVLDFEPGEALFVPDDEPLLFYSGILRIGKELLSAGGKMYFEINERFGEEIFRMINGAGYCRCSVLKDINDKDRFVESVFFGF